MLKQLIGAVFGTRHEREQKRVQPIVDEINAHFARLRDIRRLDVGERELMAGSAGAQQQARQRQHEIGLDVVAGGQAERNIHRPIIESTTGEIA